MGFATALTERSADNYADFLLPHLAPGSRLLDAGCGDGTITLGLAARVDHVVGIDVEDQFGEARAYALKHGIGNVEFRTGSVYSLDDADHEFDACFCHSVLEELERPHQALRELRRVLRPGGVIGVACVEYGGLILGGSQEPLLRRFYAIRERLWQLDAGSDPYRGRGLRGLLKGAGFADVVATTKTFSYGTDEAVAAFGAARAADCRNDWYVSTSQAHGLVTESELRAMDHAWLEWSNSPGAYAAFAWCRAVGYKPPDPPARR